MDIFLLHLQLEHSQLGSSVVHQLVYKMKEPLCISLNISELLSHPGVVAFPYHLRKRIDDQRQRRAHFVGYVDEESHLHLMDILLVTLFLLLQLQPVFPFLPFYYEEIEGPEKNK